jgi:hypothetical protein
MVPIGQDKLEAKSKTTKNTKVKSQNEDWNLPKVPLG